MKKVLSLATIATLLTGTAAFAADRENRVAMLAERAANRLAARGIARDHIAPHSVIVDDQTGSTHVRFNQVIDGVPVFGQYIISHEGRDGRFSVDGETQKRSFTVNSVPTLSSDEAAGIALSEFGEGVASARLVMMPTAYGYQLAYDVDVKNTLGNDAVDTPRRDRVFINAHNGAVLMRYDNLQTGKPGTGGGSSSGTAALGTGKGFFAGTVTNLPIAVSGTTYLLQDVTNNGKTYDFNNNTCNIFGCGTNTGTLFTSTSNTFGTDGSLSNRASIGVDAHFFAQKTLEYFKTTFARNGIDGNNNKNLQMGHMVSRTHYGRGYNNAYWDGASMTYGDGDGTTYRPFDALDVVGHEMTHGITERTSDLVYQNESGAANESYSDIFGVVIEFKTGTVTGFGGVAYPSDWWIGEDLYYTNNPSAPTRGIRNMADPHKEGDPDHYSERYTGTSDNGGVHTNSGIQNKVFYLLVNGGTNSHTPGVTVAGVGLDTAAKIAYNALTVYTTNSNATYAQTAKAWVTAASQISTAAADSARNAWIACGVTPAP
jgi:Zn-dependent metalloprotease